jgi:hypothetical protein
MKRSRNRWILFAAFGALGGALFTVVQARLEAWSVRDPTSWGRRTSGIGMVHAYWNGWLYGYALDASGRILYLGSFAEAADRRWDLEAPVPRSLDQVALAPPGWSRPADGAPSVSRPLDRVSLHEFVFGWPARSMSSRIAVHAPVDGDFNFIRDAVKLQCVVDGVGIESPPPVDPQKRFDLHYDLLKGPWITANESVPSAIFSNTDELTPVHETSGVSVHRVSYPFALPTRMLPLGFLLNTLFYTAALLAVPLASRGAFRAARFALRNSAAARARRGECRACGHPLAGLARCPECGTVVK